jgi:hypothetical protein
MNADLFQQTDAIIDQISEEMKRIWGGDDAFEGTEAEYAWLSDNYGVSEEDDVHWVNVIMHHSGDMATLLAAYPEGDEEREDLLAFLEDPEAVYAFLQSLLKRYQSNSAVYARLE